eukprot:2427523-Rhodomonas_salina.1
MPGTELAYGVSFRGRCCKPSPAKPSQVPYPPTPPYTPVRHVRYWPSVCCYLPTRPYTVSGTDVA